MTRASTIVFDTPSALSAPGLEPDPFEAIGPAGELGASGIGRSTRTEHAGPTRWVPAIRGT